MKRSDPKYLVMYEDKISIFNSARGSCPEKCQWPADTLDDLGYIFKCVKDKNPILYNITVGDQNILENALKIYEKRIEIERKNDIQNKIAELQNQL